MTENKQENRVLIIGAGIAGITTAIELLEQGFNVVILDRDSPEKLGGMARLSFGGMFFVDSPQQRKSGIKDSPELAFEDWCNVAGFTEDDVWPRKWAQAYVYHCTEKVQQWLNQHKVKFFPVVHWVERGRNHDGNRNPRFHMVWGTGQELTLKLIEALNSLGKSTGNLSLHFHHTVLDFVLEQGRVAGVKGRNEATQKPFQLNASNIVVASGGMGGNLEKVRKFWPKYLGDPPREMLNGLRPEIDGSMLERVEAIDGKLTHMDQMWPYAAGVHHPRPSFAGEGLSLVPPKSALWLNYKGERIGPEPLVTGFDTRYLVEQVVKQEKKFSWQVLNRKIAEKEFAISGAEFNPAIRDKKWVKFIWTLLNGNKALVKDMMDHCPDFVVANNLDELVEKMNALTQSNDIDPAVLKKTIASYDGEIRKGPKHSDDIQIQRIKQAREYRGDKVRTCAFQAINDPKAYPLIAIREFIVSRKTLGGAQTNLKCEVLDREGKSINGLYAIGEAAGFGGGGMHGKGALEGTFLGGCIFTGRAAAHAIAGKFFMES